MLSNIKLIDFLPKVIVKHVESYVPDFEIVFRNGMVKFYNNNNKNNIYILHEAIHIKINTVLVINFNGVLKLQYLKTIEGDVICIGDCSRLFHNNKVLSSPIGHWDMSKVTSCRVMFCESNYNYPLNQWDVFRINDMSYMFGRSKYNHPLNQWNVSRVTNMAGMFRSSIYNHPLDKWNISSVKDMTSMFRSSKYNHPLNNWCLSYNFTNMTGMFKYTKYKHPLDKWDCIFNLKYKDL